MTFDIDVSYTRLLSALPPALRLLASELPIRLGWERWSDYATLEPFQELPIFAAESRSVAGMFAIGDDVLSAYRVAHHHGGFWGVTADRIRDGECERSEELSEVVEALELAWRKAMSDALADRHAAFALVDSAIVAWETGLELERRALKDRRLDVAEYRRLVQLKTEWLTLAGRSLAARLGDPMRAQGFAQACELLLLASQCLDDAVDADDDASIRDASVPALLGVPRGALVQAAFPLLQKATRVAQRAEFHALARWLNVHTRALQGSFVPSAAERVAGWLLIAELD